MLPVFAPLAPLRALFPTDEHRVSASFLTPLLCKLCVYSTLLSSSLYVSVCVCVCICVRFRAGVGASSGIRVGIFVDLFCV